jgi:glycosyltransferase involved in cell wall biosynthesis
MKNSFRADFDIPSYVTRSSVDMERFSEVSDKITARKKLGLERDLKYVGIAARPAPEKGPEFLLEIIKKVETRENVRLLWAGESSWKDHIRNIFVNAGLKNRIKFLGYIPNIEDFYSSCDVIALTSKNNSIEASPSAVLETMAMAKPVVASRSGGIPETIDSGINGFLFEYGDSERFAGCIGNLLDNPLLAERIGRNARKKIEQFHNIDTNTGRLAEILQNAVKKDQKNL